MMIIPNNSAPTGHSQQMSNNFAIISNIPPQNPAMIANNPWVITPLEHQSNEGQFIILHPIGVPLMIGGEQARPFFFKSGLPSTILAQIWQLADLNKDGKLDRLEFSIAMKLVRNCLAGLPLPPTLPDSMRQISGLTTSTSVGQFNGGVNLPSGPIPPAQMPPRPMSTYGTMPAMSSSYRPPPTHGGSYSAAQTPTHGAGVSIPFQMGTKELGDWSLPQPVKLRYCQQFNQLDRSRVGLLTGQQARGVLGESQLPTQLLAQIWNMSDVNKDGCLSIEEFCTAQFLIEMMKFGYALPSKLPNELHTFCNRSKTVSPSTVSSTPTDPNAPPPQKGGIGHFKTFEDKRRDNLDKGQAELDRRRQILREEEERRRAEIERREREETERKERERHELERKREAEMEVERQKELEKERERAVEEEKMKAHREEARRRLEMERIKELEKIRIRDLENQLQAETEKTTQIQQRQKTMAFQLQALDERSHQLNQEITVERDKILEITQEIEGMRGKRDEKCAKIQEVEKKARELNVQSERFGHENLQLQSECQRQLSRTNEIDALRNEMTKIVKEMMRMEGETKTISERAESQEKLVIGKRPDWEKSCKHFREIEISHQELTDRYDQKRREIHPNAFVPISIAPPQYEMPPDAIFGLTAERRSSRETQGSSNSTGFDNNFTPNFPTSFGQVETQKSIDDETRRRSESGSTGNVAAIAAKLQQQLQFNQPPQQKQALSSREGSVTSTGKPSIQPSLSIEGLQQQQSSQIGITGTNLKTVKYRALYEFVARSGDELSLQPGDVIMVFEGHQSEPGWLAGQIRDKVGWFPASFSEPIALSSTSPSPAAVALKKAGSLTGSPSGEPLAIIQEEGEVPAGGQDKKQQATTLFQADFASAFPKSVSFTDPYSQPPTTISASRSIGAFTAAALYDLPPTEKEPDKIEQHFEQNAPIPPAFAPPLYEMPPGDGGTSSSSSTEKNTAIQGVGVALYQWKARNEQEMSFARGDIIEVLEQGEMRWRGQLQKNKKIQGWFPKSYIKMDTNILSDSSKIVQGQDEPLQNGKGNTQQQQNNMIEQQQRRASQTKDVVGEWFIALYQFDAVEATDLSLKPGDRILVTDQKDQWWRGNCEGRSGIFPANYVQRATESGLLITSGMETDKKMTTGRAIAAFDATASNQISLRIGEIVRVHQMTSGGWWEGELEREGQKHVGWFPGNYIQVMNVQGSDKRFLAVAAFDYQAQHDDELTFKAGDTIEVFDRTNAQWWKGKRQNDIQQIQPLLFPANFVQLQ